MHPAPAVRSAPETPCRRSPLPDRARHPLILLLVVVLPQAVLLVLNAYAGYLMSGEMTAEQSQTAVRLFGLELALLTGTSAFAWHLLRRNRPVSWAANWAVFLPHAGYLTAVTLAIGEGRLIPSSVELWIVPSAQLLFYQWVFVMPAVFYSMLALSCFPTKRGRWFEAVACCAVTGGIPLLWYLAMQTLHRLNVPGSAVLVLVVGSSFICLAGFLRLVTMLYVWADRSNPVAQSLLALGVGLLGPLGGLALNARVPFPADFQSPWIYALAVLNGVFLVLPVTNRPVIDRIIWLARCAMLPFTLYFFLVFLPFLPLAIPAMALMGAGFLMLVPTALAIVHLRGVVRMAILEIREGWGKLAVVWAVGAASLLPAALTGTALLDRASLHRAIDFVFTPDYRRSDTFTGSLWFTRRALEHLRDQKVAAYLPFLSEFYEQVVFDGLTLSFPKMQAIHQAFFGHPLPTTAMEGVIGFRNAARERAGRAARPFPHDVKLTELTVSSRVEQGCTVTSAVLSLENQLPEQAEYVVRIELPPGVLVSGYWLKVGTERVAGQIFEKKTALWVYQMIRDVTRRDPGVLVYTGPNTLELRVFPFAGKESRVTGLEFLSPPGLEGTVRIGDQIVAIDSPSSGSAMVAGEGAARLILPAEAAALLPQMVRRPYLHFLVDRAAGSSLTPAKTVELIRKTAREFPEAAECLVTVGNYEFRDLTSGLLPLDRVENLLALSERDWLPTRGSFFRDRGMIRGLLKYQDRFVTADETSPWFWRYPIFVVLSASQGLPELPSDLEWFANRAPDADRYFVADEEGTLHGRRFDGRPITGPAVSRAVRVLRAQETLAVISADGAAVASFPGEANEKGIEVFDPERRRFEPVTGAWKLDGDRSYARGAAAFGLAEKIVENPSLAKDMLPAVIKASRASGMLVPSSAYIVVENSAQWKMLKLKEGKKLSSRGDLDFMETPEPSAVLVALVAGVWLLRRRGRREV
jgi:hypothetical protein